MAVQQEKHLTITNPISTLCFLGYKQYVLLIPVWRGRARVSVAIASHRSYHCSTCHVNIYGMNNKSQLHYLLTSDGYCAISKCNYMAFIILRFFLLISLKLFICSVLVQEDNPSICFRKPGRWQRNISYLTAIEMFHFAVHCPNVDVSWSCSWDCQHSLPSPDLD